MRAVDEWVGESADRPEVVAQIGPSSYRPRHLTYATAMSPHRREHMLAADLIVAHAGIGTIIGALELGKSVLVMARRAELGEHRNDHQLGTARRLAELGHVWIAGDVPELRVQLDGLESLSVGTRVTPHAADELIGALAAFIDGDGLTSFCRRRSSPAPRVGFGRQRVRARH